MQRSEDKALKPKAPREKDFTKRRSVEDGLKLADAAHVAVWRLYCDVFALWRRCRKRPCRRHCGEPAGCLMRGLPSVPPAQRETAAKEVIAGGRKRIAPASHIEWHLRREPLPMITTWRR
jgi:hypothetical protein